MRKCIKKDMNMTFGELILNFKRMSLFYEFWLWSYSKQKIEGDPKAFEIITLYTPIVS